VFPVRVSQYLLLGVLNEYIRGVFILLPHYLALLHIIEINGQCMNSRSWDTVYNWKMLVGDGVGGDERGDRCGASLNQ
jgi:hypothetical protein